MEYSRLLAGLLCVGVIASAAPAQSSGSGTGTSASSPAVMDMIPASALAYVVAPSVKDATDSIDKFMNDISVGTVSGGVLAKMKEMAMLGDGFNADGGMAIVIMDPQVVGLDLVKLINSGGGDGPPEPEKWPLVLLIPGKGVTEVFGEMAANAHGDYFTLALPAVPIPMKAAYKKGYVVISPSTKAIKAVMADRRSAAKYSPKEHVTLISRSKVAFHVNMKVGGPIISAITKGIEDQLKGGNMKSGIMPFDMSKMMLMYRNLIDQVDAITLSARLTASDAIVEEMVTFTPGSGLAKASIVTTKAKPVLNRLPNLPYVFAVAGITAQDKAAADASMKITTGMLGGLLPKELIEKLSTISNKLVGQVTSVQLVGGGAPSGSGLFGVSCVLACKDSSVVTGALGDSAALMMDMIKSLSGNDRDVAKLTISYLKGTEKTGKISVDAIMIDHPDLAKQSERNRDEMKKSLGEDKIRFLVAAPDKNTVVVTFGGSLPFMDEAVKAAKGDGNLVTSTQATSMAKYMPQTTTTLMVFSMSNLWDVIKTGMATMGEGKALPFPINTKEPVVIAGGVTGDATHVVIAVPIGLIKDVTVGMQQMFANMSRGIDDSEPMPPAGGDDF